LEGRSHTGSQAGVPPPAVHGRARIIDVTPGRLRSALDEGAIAIVAGFQGVSQDTKDITTLGRGGSHTTAAALAAPRIVPDAQHIKQITYEEMLELAAGGAKVLMLRCVEYARRFNVPIHVRSPYSKKPGTLVPGSMEDPSVEQALITGVAHDRSEAKITIVGVPDEPGAAGRIFASVAQAEINIDMIVQNVSTEGTGRTDISFTLPKADGPTAMAALSKIQDQIKFKGLVFDDNVGKVSLIGAGMRSHPGVAASFFACIGAAGVNIEMISTSEIRVSVVCRDRHFDTAVRAVHEQFELGGSEQAVVYAGTGR